MKVFGNVILYFLFVFPGEYNCTANESGNDKLVLIILMLMSNSLEISEMVESKICLILEISHVGKSIALTGFVIKS